MLCCPAPRHLNLTFHGPEYPQPPAQSLGAPLAQSFKLTLWCDPQIESPNITITGYDGSQLHLEYHGAAGCPLAGSPNPDEGKKPEDGKEPEPVGSGLGWFFMLYVRNAFPEIRDVHPDTLALNQVPPGLYCVLWNWGILQLFDVWCPGNGSDTVSPVLNFDSCLCSPAM